MLALAVVFLTFVAAFHAAEAKGGRDGSRRGGDHDQVWRERQSGKILPLEQILAILPPEARRRILEIEFDIEHGAPIYEIEYVDNRGRVIEIEIDARSGRILKQEID